MLGRSPISALPLTAPTAPGGLGWRMVVAPGLCARRCALTLSGTLVKESGTYAVLLSGSGDNAWLGTRLPDELFSLCQADGGDVCFTSDANGTVQLPCQLVSINPSAKTAEIWVAVPLTASTAATIYVWYQSKAGVLAQPAASGSSGSQAAWQENGTQNLAGVWHLEEFGAPYADATVNAKNSTAGTYPTQATGRIGEGQSFANNYIALGANTDFAFTTSTPFTLQAWIKTNATFNAVGGILGKYAQGVNGYFLSSHGDGAGHAFVYGQLQSSDSTYKYQYGTINVGDNAWHLVTFTYDGSNTLAGLKIYVDGVNDAGSPAQAGGLGSLANSARLTIGTREEANPTGDAFSGSLDEARVATVARSANYVATDYAMQASSALVTVGAPTPVVSASAAATDTLSLGDTAGTQHVIPSTSSAAAFTARLGTADACMACIELATTEYGFAHPATSALTLGDSAVGWVASALRPALDPLAVSDTNSLAINRIRLPLTPIMSDATTPLGAVSSSALFGAGSFPAYRVFDGGNDADHMSVLAAQFPCWWQYQFPEQQMVTAFALWGRADGYSSEMPCDFWLEGSADGTNWTVLATVTGEINWQVGQKRIFEVGTPGWYTYYRLRVTANNGSPDAVSLGELFLYGPATLVPTMTSNTTPSGVASSSDSSATAYQAFDNDYKTGIASQAASFPCWWQYQFAAPTEVDSFALWAPFAGDPDGQMPKAFALQGSADGATWTTLSSAIPSETGWAAGEYRHYPLATTGSYTYYRLLVTANNGSATACAFGELALMPVRVPAVLADGLDALALDHQASAQVSHCPSALDTVVLTDLPYYGRPFTSATTTYLAVNDQTHWMAAYPVAAQDGLELGDTAHARHVRSAAATSALALSQNSILTRCKYVVQPLSFTQAALVHKLTRPQATDEVPVADVANGRNATFHLPVVDAIPVADTPAARDSTFHLLAWDTLSLSDGGTGRDATFRADATEQVGFADEVGLHQSPARLLGMDHIWPNDTNAVEQTKHWQVGSVDALALADWNIVIQPIYVSAIDPVQSSQQQYNPYAGLGAGGWTGDFELVFTGLQDSASAVIQHGTSGAGNRLSFGELAQVAILRATAKAAGATDALSLGDEAIENKVGSQTDAIPLGELIAVTHANQPTTDPLTVGDQAVVAVVRLLGATDAVQVDQAFVYILPLKTADQMQANYTPFVGAGATGNPAPPPRTLSGASLPSPSAPGDFTLVYPAAGPVQDYVTLRNPEFGDKNRLQFNRISRETRGGTLIVYADPMWPKIETLALTFSGLSPMQAEALLDFIRNHIGQEIGIWDWERRRWTGIITQPNEPVVEDDRNQFTGSFEFEGELVSA